VAEPDAATTQPAAGDPERPERSPSPRTVYLRDPSRTALAHNQSPDVGFDSSLNPYRGCEHGCVYCYARPTHEYLGFSAGLDFETRILVKEDAPELLRRELGSRRWKPEVVGLCGVTDPYQPIERRLQLTRRCLRVFADFRNPVQLVTKNGLVARDVDILAELAEHEAVAVNVSVTTLDANLQRLLEPRASHPRERLKAVERLSQLGIPVGVLVAPIIPGLTEHEIPAILSAAAEAGARSAGHIVLRLPHGVKDLFSAWLERHFPDRRDKVLNRVRALRGGRLDDPRFGSRMKGEGVFARQIHDLFELSRRRAGIPREGPKLSTAAFRRPADAQLKLFRS
jgi:DNA repair photolyase